MESQLKISTSFDGNLRLSNYTDTERRNLCVGMLQRYSFIEFCIAAEEERFALMAVNEAKEAGEYRRVSKQLLNRLTDRIADTRTLAKRETARYTHETVCSRFPCYANRYMADGGGLLNFFQSQLANSGLTGEVNKLNDLFVETASGMGNRLPKLSAAISVLLFLSQSAMEAFELMTKGAQSLSYDLKSVQFNESVRQHYIRNRAIDLIGIYAPDMKILESIGRGRTKQLRAQMKQIQRDMSGTELDLMVESAHDACIMDYGECSMAYLLMDEIAGKSTDYATNYIARLTHDEGFPERLMKLLRRLIPKVDIYCMDVWDVATLIPDGDDEGVLQRYRRAVWPLRTEN